MLMISTSFPFADDKVLSFHLMNIIDKLAASCLIGNQLTGLEKVCWKADKVFRGCRSQKFGLRHSLKIFFSATHSIEAFDSFCSLCHRQHFSNVSKIEYFFTNWRKNVVNEVAMSKKNKDNSLTIHFNLSVPIKFLQSIADNFDLRFLRNPFRFLRRLNSVIIFCFRRVQISNGSASNNSTNSVTSEASPNPEAANVKA